ncbi:MAG: hypothetical protein LBD67_00660 [Candidatus Accumulibacter sp.]|nr:hypothetical protein [Accumulibacter sp.]
MGLLLRSGAKQGPVSRYFAGTDSFETALSGFIARKTARGVKKKHLPNSVGVVVSNNFCRYLVVPWSDAFLQKEESVAYLRTEFGNVYGNSVEDWEIISQNAGYDRPRVACAMDASLLRSLREGCEQMGLKLAFCRPYLSMAFDHFLRYMDGVNGIFALVEKNVLTFTAWSDNDIMDVDVEHCEEKNWTNVLTGWCERNRLMEGGAFKIFVVCPSGLRCRDIPSAGETGWNFLGWSDDAQILVSVPPEYYFMPACAIWA